MPLRVGLIGCGNISDIYLINAALFRDYDFVACADLKDEAARKQADKYGLHKRSIADIVELSSIEPAAHQL